MNLLADESIDMQVVRRLRDDGHQVLFIAEMEPGISDEKVLAVANERDALLLTADKDFGELVFRLRRTSGGVMLARLAGLPPSKKAEIIASVVRDYASELLGTFTVVTPGIVRIRPRVI